MSEFNLTWSKYGLKDNPYFHYPLNIEETQIPLSAFVGREEEKKELKRIIELGGDIRYMITGDAGVGKTSLVNYVRGMASKKPNTFFTPLKEIELNRIMSGNEIIILTISALYTEIKRKKLDIDENLLKKLEALYELTKYGELSSDIANLVQINRQKLMELFNDVVEAIVNPRYYGIIIHYDNLDNIDDFEGLADMISDIRDFLFHKKVVFLFVGDNYLPQILMKKVRVSQIFITPSLSVNSLKIQEINQILNKRLDYFKVENSDLISPHSEEAVNLLFKIHNGNLRDILNSLTTCVSSLASTNTPIQIDGSILTEILYKKINEKVISQLTEKDRNILYLIWKKEIITPTELSKITKHSIQNISAYYLKKLKNVQAIRERGKEGRNVYYEVTPNIKWLDLKEEFDKIETKKRKKKEDADRLLNEFF